MKIMYIFEEEQEAACGECGENCNLGAGSAPFDLHYCPHCGIQFIYGTKYLKNRIEFSKYFMKTDEEIKKIL